MRVEDLEPEIFGERVKIHTWLKSWELADLKSALKLQELVKERIDGFNKTKYDWTQECKSMEISGHELDDNEKETLQSLVEESEK